MFHKFQNIYGICYTYGGETKDISKILKNLVDDIKKDKEFPFSDVYVRIPIFFIQKFLDQVRLSDLKYKEMESKNNIFLLKF